jgi:hypothetical protein
MTDVQKFNPIIVLDLQTICLNANLYAHTPLETQVKTPLANPDSYVSMIL